MTKQLLFIQGAGGDTYDGWDIRLVESLRQNLGKGFEVRYPRMPGAENPKGSAWTAAIRQEFAALRDGDVLVGHSFGGTMLLHALKSPPPFAPAALVLLAAPFFGDGGWDGEELAFDAQLPHRLPASLPIRLYHGKRDDTVPFAHLALFAEILPAAKTIAVPEADHQFNDDLAEVARDLSRLVKGGSHEQDQR